MTSPRSARRLTAAALLLFAAPASLAVAQQQRITVQDILSGDPIPPDHRIAYGDHPLQFGDLRIPVLAYSAVLCAMASLAIGLGPRIAVGAGLFLVSDLFIAFGQADIDFALRAATIMPTYLAGQYLIVTGWGRRVDPDVVVPA